MVGTFPRPPARAAAHGTHRTAPATAAVVASHRTAPAARRAVACARPPARPPHPLPHRQRTPNPAISSLPTLHFPVHVPNRNAMGIQVGISSSDRLCVRDARREGANLLWCRLFFFLSL